jgi:hypothetical protein
MGSWDRHSLSQYRTHGTAGYRATVLRGEHFGTVIVTAELTAGASDVLRHPETRKGLNSGLTLLARWDQTEKNAMPLSPQLQGAGAIPVPPALEFRLCA